MCKVYTYIHSGECTLLLEREAGAFSARQRLNLGSVHFIFVHVRYLLSVMCSPNKLGQDIMLWKGTKSQSNN
jgi:hypothetical protein